MAREHADTSAPVTAEPSWTPAPGAAAPELWVCSAISRSVPFDLAAVIVAADLEDRAALIGSDPRLRHFGDLQQSLAEGPGVDLFRTAAPVVVADLQAEGTRWPLLTSSPGQPVTLHSLALLPLRAQRTTTVVGLLAAARTRVQPFTAAEQAVLVSGASLVTAMLLERLRRTPASLATGDPVPDELGLSDDDLGAALGMVMAAVSTDRAGALARLRARAFVLGCTVHELATEIVAGRGPAGDE